MADGGSNKCAGNDVVELEAMRKDSSWNPCQVSLCSRGSGLMLHENNNSEEIIMDKQEIFTRIRVRSTPLQGDDCSSIREGEHVLATKSTRVKGVFYDARVEEAIRVRHSKRIHCRCSFRIKWLHRVPEEEEGLSVPASAIMKLATKSIHLHPTISAFCSMRESPNGLDAMPMSMIVYGINSEMDINMLLEKQIKEISNLTEISQEIFPTNIPFTDEVNASVDTLDTFPQPNKWKGLNGNESNQPTKTKSEIPPVCIPSSEEDLTGSRFLSPLAARAALASLRSETPQSPQLSSQSKCCSFSVDHPSNTGDFSVKILATLEGKSSDFESIVKTLFPESNAPQRNELSNLSSGAQMDKKKRIEENSNHPSKSRLTHAQAQKVNGMLETTPMTSNNEAQLRLTTTRRVTRSTVEVVHAEKNGVQPDVQREAFIRDTGKQNYPKRQTRSAAREESQETEENNVQPKLKLRKSSSAKSNDNKLEPENSLTPPLAAVEVSEQSTKGTEKNRKAFARVKSTPKTSEGGVGSRTRQQSASSTRQDTRSSERLRLLPRTRSQSKA